MQAVDASNRISGSNRGIELILNHRNAVVFAGVRNPDSDACLELRELAKQHTDRFPVNPVSADAESNKAVAKEIETRYGRVDTVIANAGIANFIDTVVETPPDQLRELFEVNAIEPVILFQAAFSLLRASNNPKFIPVSSGGGSISQWPSLPVAHATGHPK